MAWTTPKTWTSEVLTSNDMNTYLSDNTQYLYDQINTTPEIYSYIRTTGDYSTTSTSYVDIDATNMSATITTTGGDVIVTFAGTVTISSSGLGHIAIDYDGTVYAPIYMKTRDNVSFSLIFDNVSAGSHTFTMQWKNAGPGVTATLSGNSDTSAHFSVRELK